VSKTTNILKEGPLMMTLSNLFYAMTERGIDLIVREGQLCASAPRGSVTPELRDALARYRDELADVLGIKASLEAKNHSGQHTGVAADGALEAPRCCALATPAEPPPVLQATNKNDPEPAQSGARYRFGVGWDVAYRPVTHPDDFRAFVARLGRQSLVVFDLETTGLDPTQAQIVGYAFCWKPGEAWYLPVQAPEGEACLDYHHTLDQLRPVFEDPDVAKVNQNIKFDLLVLRHHGIAVAGVRGDTMMADYLLRAGEFEHGLDALALRHLDYEMIPIEALIGKPRPKRPQLTMAEVSLSQTTVYAAEDADVAFRLNGLLQQRLRATDLEKLYADLEVPLIGVLAEMEFHGVRLDVPLLKSVSAELAGPLEQMEADIYALAGHPFNINSPKQVRRVLFDEQKLPPQSLTKSKELSTDADALTALAKLGHALPQRLLEYRGLAKLKSTYLDALPGLISPATGRLHTSFNQAVTATGRFSSSDPNLQNIPTRTEQGKKVRQAFIPADGWVLLKADYSQIELRLLAHFSGDAELRRAYQEDRDIHSLVAAQCYGVPEAEVTGDQRRFAKTINFGVIYGMSAYGLAGRLDISMEVAAQFIDAYFARYPTVASYQDELLESCRRQGFVTTLLSRRRYIRGVRLETSYRERNEAEREAVNMQIQGSAADLIKVAMLNIHRRLRREKRQARMLLTVHDELVFEVPSDELESVASLVREEMEEAIALAVPLKADLATGPNWLEMQKW
jgi:DNA polymerase-1